LKQLKNGKLGVVDSTRTIQFMYNAYYWATNLASLSSIPVTFLEKEYGFWAAFVLTLASIVLALILFVFAAPRLGKADSEVISFRNTNVNLIVRVLPQGNNLPKAAKAIICAAKNGFKFDNAKPAHQMSLYGKVVPWSDLFVDEMRRGVLACRVM
jgi:POT family proton-dependent oligopeptide transporter